ncbi:MAG: glycosyltransferase [Muribaculaceae bacterium]|nr:glycosyltransferase [Muribaculaceae bacterium]
MKIVIINKSDSTGGAAVVSRRLMEALRAEGVDARMLVAEKITDSEYVELAASPLNIKFHFLRERLKIFFSNGFNRKTLFKIDTGEVGLPLWKHPLVKEADAILLNWINQGLLSLKGVGKVLALGKPVIWTMHDMWNMTGVCHHAGRCSHFLKNCGDCPLLGRKAGHDDLSKKIHGVKERLYIDGPHRITFVAVSNWLKAKGEESELLKGQKIEVIGNAFPIDSDENTPDVKETKVGDKPGVGRIGILFGAARLDDPIKGLETMREVSGIIAERYPTMAKNLELRFFGDYKNHDSLEGFGLPVKYLGVLKGEESIARAYRDSHIVVSASSYETLPGTLVEAQAYGCIPVAFNRGGQGDIVEHLSTGYIAAYDEDLGNRAENLARGILWGADVVKDEPRFSDMKEKMHESVMEKFSGKRIAGKYMKLLEF